jgi:hypothetical protein
VRYLPALTISSHPTSYTPWIITPCGGMPPAEVGGLLSHHFEVTPTGASLVGGAQHLPTLASGPVRRGRPVPWTIYFDGPAQSGSLSWVRGQARRPPP